jgi:hypothetical protein
VGISTIDRELHAFIPKRALNRLASHGLRGEMLFPVPCLIKANPAIAGYFRLVLGISGKEYGRHGLKIWIQAEKGERVRLTDGDVSGLCQALIPAGVQLLGGVNGVLSKELFHELSLLTLGAQLDGGYRTIIGQRAVEQVQSLIEAILRGVSKKAALSKNEIVFRNNSGREIIIRFGSDPDILILERIRDNLIRKLAIEVKGGVDPSNIHNRLGEAEKAHNKLEKSVLKWTITGVPIEEAVARQRSPSTAEFFVLSDLVAGKGGSFIRFKQNLASIMGLRYSA